MSDALGLVGTTVVEKYAVEAVVGEGGFAVVYRATHLLWKRTVAIKVFSVLDSVPAEMRDKLLDDFLREGALLAQLSEQTTAIVQARDVGMLTTHSGLTVPYMVLEWLEGETLESLLQREREQGAPPRSMREAVALLTPVADALAVAHGRGIVHRDVKPANIFLVGPVGAAGATLKLLDFGIAKVVQDAQKMAGSFAKTSGVVTSFTPAYGAPEQFSRTYGATGPWTDVFALALILGEMTSGRAPIDGDDMGQLAFASMNEQVRPSPRTLGANVSDAVESVLLHALAVKVVERSQTAREFWTQLTAALAVADSSLHPSRPAHVEVASAATMLAPEAIRTDLAMPRSLAPTNPGAQPKPMALFWVGGAAVIGAAAIIGVLALKGKAKGDGTSTPMPSSTSTTVGGSTRSDAAGIVSGAGMDSGACPSGMVAVPGGQFFLGSDDGEAAEKPAHAVVLAPYCIDRFEVSVEKYEACSKDGGCKRASSTNEWDGISAKDHDVYDPLCNIRQPADRGQHPVNCVSWEKSAIFCQATGKRLPTEAEWEFAARGSDGRKYPWGDDAPTGGHVNACGLECVDWGKAHGVSFVAMYAMNDHFPNTSPVGTFPAGASRFGVEDVVGNVWEWVDDWYGPYKAGKIGQPEHDPKGPADGKQKVIRGGAWNSSDPNWLRPSFRYRDTPAKESFGIGFRCAKSLP